MKKQPKLLAACLLGFAIVMISTMSCTRIDVGEPIPDPSDTLAVNPNPGPPVETRDPSGNIQPVFAWQTRGPSIQTTTAITVTEMLRSDSVYKPWSINFIDNERILLTQKDGYFRVVSINGDIGAAFKIPNVYFNDNFGGSNAGLFDVVFDPQFSQNQTVYFTYSRETPNGNTLTVAKAKLMISGLNISVNNIQDIYAITPSIGDANVYGGRLLFDEDGYLLVTTGARLSSNSEFEAQNLTSSLGKILRIDGNGNAAPNNPFSHITGALPEIWATGIRSPLGFAKHPVTGEVWETEHGPNGGDEVNIIRRGKNYGWPVISFGLNYNGTPVGTGYPMIGGSVPPAYQYDPVYKPAGLTQKDQMEQPVYYWNPSIAPGGITFYNSTVISEWKNNLFVAGLNGKHLIRLVFSGSRMIGEERLLVDKHTRLRDVTVGPDGALYVTTDTPQGVIYRVGL